MRINSAAIVLLLVLWLIITGCAISSILSQPFTKKQRLFWIVFVLVAPMIGILAYLPFSFNKEEVPDIFLMKQRKKHRPSAGPVTKDKR